MSYQLYVTGGYGFTESMLPSLLHPSEAVSIAQDYFSCGYQGSHLEPPPNAMSWENSSGVADNSELINE